MAEIERIVNNIKINKEFLLYFFVICNAVNLPVAPADKPTNKKTIPIA
jgi:hypothetical protein